MQRYGLVVRFLIKPGHAQAFDQLVAETIAGIRASEPGTLIYASHRIAGGDGEDSASGDVRVFYELYADRSAFEAHEQQPHTRHFLL